MAQSLVLQRPLPQQARTGTKSRTSQVAAATSSVRARAPHHVIDRFPGGSFSSSSRSLSSSSSRIFCSSFRRLRLRLRRLSNARRMRRRFSAMPRFVLTSSLDDSLEDNKWGHGECRGRGRATGQFQNCKYAPLIMSEPNSMTTMTNVLKLKCTRKLMWLAQGGPSSTAGTSDHSDHGHVMWHACIAFIKASRN